MAKKAEKQSRRKFIFNLGIIGTLIIAVLAFIRSFILYIFPRDSKKTFHKYLVSKEGEIPLGEAKEITLGKTPVFVVHLDEGYRVFSGICTHLGCIVQWKQEKNHFYCPCHKGYFDKNGQVIGGPPPRPLDEYRVEVENSLVYMYVQDKKKGPWA